jgi:predicted metal-dependent peptidase
MSTTKTTITEEELKELKKKSVEILSGARRALLLKYPFIGSLLMRMNLIPVRDMRVRTACTDGESVYFDIDFLSRLSTEEQIFVLGHELYHGVLLHLTRLQSRDPELFNIATDKEVNNLLKQDGLTPPCHLLFPEGAECGKSAEEIYEILLKKMKKQAKQQMQNGSGGMGGKNSQSNSNSSDDESDDSQDGQQNGNQKKNGKKSKKSGILSLRFLAKIRLKHVKAILQFLVSSLVYNSLSFLSKSSVFPVPANP